MYFNLQIGGKPRLEPNTNSWTLLQALSTAGEVVSVETALTIPALSAGVRVISESIGMLPCKLMHNFDGKTSPAYNRNEYKVLAVEANPYTTASEFITTMIATSILYGDAVAEKEYAADGSLKYLYFLSPDRLKDIYIDKKSKQIRYIIDGKDFGRDTIFHLKGAGYNKTGFRGTGIVEYGREAIGLALAEIRYASAYFANGAVPAAAVLTKAPMSPEQNDNFVRSWNSKYKGAKKSGKFAVLPDGVADIKTFGDDAEKSQLLESRKESVIEICRLLGIQPHKVHSLDRATFANIEQEGMSFIRDTLTPHIIGFEQSANQQLIAEKDKPFNYFKMNMDAQIRGTIADRYAAHASAIQNGWLSRNEVRAIEDREPVDGLDEYINMANLQNGNKEQK